MTGDAPQRRIALLLEYDGAGYGGSQRQKNAPTVQGTIEAALRKLTGEGLRLALAGRTDAGVHAEGQVAAFTTHSVLDIEVFVRGLNAWLPDDIAVRRAVEAPEAFDPRRHASSRTYRYTVCNAQIRSPLSRANAWHVAEPLNVAAMQAAADALVGEHDFASFSRREGVATIRCVRRCDVARDSSLVIIEMEANAFLRQQVRRTAGALVQVGMGKMAPTAFGGLLQRPEPSSAGPVAPPHGLCLVQVTYPGLDL